MYVCMYEWVNEWMSLCLPCDWSKRKVGTIQVPRPWWCVERVLLRPFPWFQHDACVRQWVSCEPFSDYCANPSCVSFPSNVVLVPGTILCWPPSCVFALCPWWQHHHTLRGIEILALPSHSSNTCHLLQCHDLCLHCRCRRVNPRIQFNSGSDEYGYRHMLLWMKSLVQIKIHRYIW